MPKPETARSKNAPAANRASRLNRGLVIIPVPLSGAHTPFEATGLRIALCSRLGWESKVRERDVKSIYPSLDRRFKMIEQKKRIDTRDNDREAPFRSWLSTRYDVTTVALNSCGDLLCRVHFPDATDPVV